MKEWSYLVEEIPDTASPAAIEIKLNEVGGGGWEAVSAWSQGNKIRFLFKKAKNAAGGESSEETIRAAHPRTEE